MRREPCTLGQRAAAAEALSENIPSNLVRVFSEELHALFELKYAAHTRHISPPAPLWLRWAYTQEKARSRCGTNVRRSRQPAEEAPVVAKMLVPCLLRTPSPPQYHHTTFV